MVEGETNTFVLSQSTMKGNILQLGLASTSLFLSSIPGAQALPKWLQLKRSGNANLSPRQYSVYEQPATTYGGYSWNGYGPLPTLSSQALPSSSTSSDSGEETSASSTPYAGNTSFFILITSPNYLTSPSFRDLPVYCSLLHWSSTTCGLGPYLFPRD